MVPPNNGETKTPIDVSSWIKVIASDKISVSTNSATLLHSTPIVSLNKKESLKVISCVGNGCPHRHSSPVRINKSSHKYEKL